MAGKITIDRERCKGCHLCIEVCPRGRILVEARLNKKGYQPAAFDGEDAIQDKKKACTGCALCALVCPEVAIEVYRDK